MPSFFKIFAGIFAVLAGHWAYIALVTLLTSLLRDYLHRIHGIFILPELEVLVPGFLSLGLGQWLYVLPLFLTARHKNQPEIGQGILLTGFMTVLLNGVCFAGLI